MFVSDVAGHSRVISAGKVSDGRVVSFSETVMLHELEQPSASISARLRVKSVWQSGPAATEMVCPLVAPLIVALPEIDQAYEARPGGALNCGVEDGQTTGEPVIEQGGNGATVKVTSLVSVQPFTWSTVRRRTAFADKT